MIRLYREEISPRLEVVLDVTRSMTTAPQKTRMAKQLATLFAVLSGTLGGRPTIWLAGDQRPALSLQAEMIDALDGTECTATASLAELIAEHQLPLRRQAVRVVVSDFLFPLDPEPLVRRLASDASVLWLVQVLTQWEADPAVSGGTRLIDIETGNETELFLNRRVIDDYKQRLQRLQEDFAIQARRCHATFVTVIADKGLPGICRDELCRSGMLRAG